MSDNGYTVDRPVAFPGTEEEKIANRNSHMMFQGRCMNCDCNNWGTVRDYPCGQEPPREIVAINYPSNPARDVLLGQRELVLPTTYEELAELTHDYNDAEREDH